MLRIVPLLLVLLATPSEAHAGFIAPIIGAIVGAVSAVGAWFAAAGFLGQLAGYLLFSALSAAIFKPKIRQEDVFRELSEPQSLPSYRFALGHCWAPGTPAPVRVKGGILYGCWILNSSPSVGPFKVFLDKREVEYTGNPFNFAGDGAMASNEPFCGREGGFPIPGLPGPFTRSYVEFWIGDGSQTSAPAKLVAQVPEFFKATDAWKGVTVLWMRLDAGPNRSFSDRWPSAPPEVIVEADWTAVWDPRDPAQDPDDRSTWRFSRNHALLTLHVLRNNPQRPYPLRHLWIDSFKWAADVAEQPLPIRAGGFIPKFRADGVLSFSQGAEVEDQVTPLLSAGAARWIRARGQLGIMPAVWPGVTGTINDFLDEQEVIYERWRPEEELYTECFIRYTAPERSYESATSPTYVVPGAEEEDQTGPRPLEIDAQFITDYRQAQYVSKIQVMRTRMQRSTSFMGFPKEVDYLAGAVVDLDFPDPYGSRNGTYEITEINPGFDPMGAGDGDEDDAGPVALRVPMSMRELVPEIFDWDAETEEKDVAFEDFNPNVGVLLPPGAVSLVSDQSTTIESGASLVPRVLMLFAPSLSTSVTSYEWQWAWNPLNQDPNDEDSTLVWTSGGLIDAESREPSGDVFGYTANMSNGQRVNVRVRSLSPSGGSEWVYSPSIVTSTGPARVAAPTAVSAISVATGIQVTYRTPNGSLLQAIEIYASSINNTSTAVRIFGPLNVSQDATISRIHTGLPDGATRYYWARSIDTAGQMSGYSAVMSETYVAP